MAISGEVRICTFSLCDGWSVLSKPAQNELCSEEKYNVLSSLHVVKLLLLPFH